MSERRFLQCPAPAAPRWLACALVASIASFVPQAGRAETESSVVASADPGRRPAVPIVPAATRAAFDALGEWVRKQSGQLSAHVVDLETGETLLSDGAERPLNPASNMKLVTAAVLLDQLGPSYEFQTGLYGKVQGTSAQKIVLRGRGDPSLTESDLWRLANALANTGVRTIEELLVDQSAFDDEYVPPAFEQQPDEWAPFRAPISAVALNRNAVVLNVAPTRADEPARVWFEPLGIVEVQGSVLTAPTGKGERVQWTSRSEAGTLQALLGGHVAEGLPRQRFSRRLDDPRLAPGQNLKVLLERLGITVGRVALGGADVESRISYTSSAPLVDLLRDVGKNSDNFYAEMLFKVLAQKAGAQPLTSAAAAEVTQRWLAALGPLPAGTRVSNGSGLFDANRLSATTLTRLLAKSYEDPRLRHDFVSHLAIGGIDGTMRSRFTTRADGRRIRAKTGSLRGAVTLSGYVLRSGTRAPIVFSLLVNGIEGQHAITRRRIDAVVSALADH